MKRILFLLAPTLLAVNVTTAGNAEDVQSRAERDSSVVAKRTEQARLEKEKVLLEAQLATAKAEKVVEEILAQYQEELNDFARQEAVLIRQLEAAAAKDSLSEENVSRTVEDWIVAVDQADSLATFRKLWDDLGKIQAGSGCEKRKSKEFIDLIRNLGRDVELSRSQLRKEVSGPLAQIPDASGQVYWQGVHSHLNAALRQVGEHLEKVESKNGWVDMTPQVCFAIQSDLLNTYIVMGSKKFIAQNMEEEGDLRCDSRGDCSGEAAEPRIRRRGSK